MSQNTDYPDETLEGDRLSHYKVTVHVEIEVSEVIMAGHASDAAEFERASVERVVNELGADMKEYELLEVDEQRGGEL